MVALPSTTARAPGDVERLSALFPTAPSRALGPRARVGVGAAVIAGMLLVLARQSGRAATGTIWAEDGTVFLAQARSGSTWDAVTTSYAGYWHLVPRLLAEVAAAAPLERAALVLAVTAALVQSALAAFVFHASRAIITAWQVRVLLALAMLVVPVGQAEVLASAANLHWFLVAAAVWALLWIPVRRWELAVATAVLVAAAASDPLVIVLAPLAMVRIWVRRSERHLDVPALAFLATGVAHLAAVAVVRPDRGIEPGSAGIGKVLAWLVVDVPGRGLLGARWLETRDAPGTILAAAVACLLVVVLVMMAVRATRWNAAPAVVLATSAVVLYVLPVGLARISPSRYSVGPALLLLGALCSAAGQVPVVRNRRVLGVALIIGLATVWTANLRLDTARSEGPSWQAELARSGERCDQGDGVAAVPISPRGWFVTIRCADLPDR